MTRRALALLPLLLLAGCLEQEQTITLEPDGAGTLRVVTTLGAELSAVVLEGRDPEGKARGLAARALARYGGVEAWSDVVAAIGSDRRVRVEGTAWFADAARLVHAAGDGPARPLVVVAGDGERLLVSLPEPDAPDELVGELGARDADALAALRARLAGLRLRTTVVVPGPVTAVSGWRQAGPDGRALSVEVGAEAIGAALDGLPPGVKGVDELDRRLRALAQGQATVAVKPELATPGFAERRAAAVAAWATSAWRDSILRAARELEGGLDHPGPAEARPAAPPDRFEPNDEREEAAALGAGEHAGLVAEAAEDDWFALTVPAKHELRVTVRIGAEDALQAKLVGEGRETIARAMIGLGADTLRAVAGEQEKKVWLCVAYGDETPYSLTVELAPWAAGDRLEPNDDEAHAAALGPGAHEGLSSDGSDWYRLEAPAGTVVDVQVRRGAGMPGRIRARIVTVDDASPRERVDALLDPRRPTARCRVLVPARGLLLHVLGDQDVPYAVEVALADPPTDALEPNDAPDQAKVLEPGSHEATLAGPDWYRVELPPGKQLVVRAESTDRDLRGEPELSLHALDAPGPALTRTSSKRGLTIARRAPGPQLLRVDGGAVLPYRLEVSLEDWTAEDAHEPNDIRADAGPLAAGAHADLKAGTHDWYRVDVPAGQQLTVSLRAAPELSLQVELWSADGPISLPVESSVTDGGTATLALESAPRARTMLLHTGPLLLLHDTPLAYTLELKLR